MTTSFMGLPSQDQGPEAQDRGDPEAHENAFLSTPLKPEVDGEQERCASGNNKAKFGHLNLGHSGDSQRKMWSGI